MIHNGDVGSSGAGIANYGSENIVFMSHGDLMVTLWFGDINWCWCFT